MRLAEISALPCPSNDGCHVLVETNPPWFRACAICGQRFALVSEFILHEVELEITERDFERVTVH